MSAIKRALNKVPAALLRSPLHGLMSKRFLLLTFNGRKSGKRYDIPVAYARDGDAFSMTTDSPWWKNLRGESGVGVPVRLRVRGKEYEGVGESITDEGEVTRVLELLLEEQPGYGRHVGLGTGGAEPAEVRRIARGRVAIRARPKVRGHEVSNGT